MATFIPTATQISYEGSHVIPEEDDVFYTQEKEPTNVTQLDITQLYDEIDLALDHLGSLSQICILTTREQKPHLLKKIINNLRQLWSYKMLSKKAQGRNSTIVKVLHKLIDDPYSHAQDREYQSGFNLNRIHHAIAPPRGIVKTRGISASVYPYIAAIVPSEILNVTFKMIRKQFISDRAVMNHLAANIAKLEEFTVECQKIPEHTTAYIPQVAHASRRRTPAVMDYSGPFDRPKIHPSSVAKSTTYHTRVPHRQSLQKRNPLRIISEDASPLTPPSPRDKSQSSKSSKSSTSSKSKKTGGVTRTKRRRRR